MDHTSTGGFRLGGCSEYGFTANSPAIYSIGDILYSKAKARKGLLRKHCIKKVITGAIYLPIVYIDTFNAIFNEEELISYEDAIEIAEAAVIQSAQELENHMLDCLN